MMDAMNEGRVLVEFVSRKKIREEKNTYGIITITVTKVTMFFIMNNPVLVIQLYLHLFA